MSLRASIRSQAFGVIVNIRYKVFIVYSPVHLRHGLLVKRTSWTTSAATSDLNWKRTIWVIDILNAYFGKYGFEES